MRADRGRDGGDIVDIVDIVIDIIQSDHGRIDG